MFLHLAICDDNRSVIDLIKGSIENAFHTYGVDCDIETFSSVKDLDKRFETIKYDIVFLDIRMPDADGIDYAKVIKAKGGSTEVVFVSSREERVFEAIQTQPFGFVRKSNFLSDISEVVKRYLTSRENKEKNNIIIVNVHGSKMSVSLDNVMYFEGYGIYQLMFLKNDDKNPVEISSKMDQLEKELSDFGFMRIHKGFLVNFFYIKNIVAGEIILKNGTRLPIARRKAVTIKEEYLALCQKFNVLTF